MRVVFSDLVAQSNNRSGIGYYASELLRCLRARLGDDLFAWPGRWGRRRRLWWEKQSDRYEYVAARPGLMCYLEKRLRGKFLSVVRKFVPPDDPLESFVDDGDVVYHEPNYIPVECGLPTVVSVHDLSVLLHPEWHPALRIKEFEKGFSAGLKRAKHLFAISEFGRRQIVEHLGWPADRVSVTYMGVRLGLRRPPAREIAAALRRLGLSEGYLLHVGTMEPRKNVLMLMRAYCDLPAGLRERCPLVLAGGRGWNSDDAHDFLQTTGRHKNVRWLGYVKEEHFPALYSGARALLFPTFYEGFGMPTIEMMACGGAVIASTAGAVAETVGGHAPLIDPNDRAAWRDALRRAVADDDWLAALRHGAEAHAARFTWEACAEATLAGYAEVVAGSARRAG